MRLLRSPRTSIVTCGQKTGFCSKDSTQARFQLDGLQVLCKVVGNRWRSNVLGLRNTRELDVRSSTDRDRFSMLRIVCNYWRVTLTQYILRGPVPDKSLSGVRSSRDPSSIRASTESSPASTMKHPQTITQRRCFALIRPLPPSPITCDIDRPARTSRTLREWTLLTSLHFKTTMPSPCPLS